MVHFLIIVAIVIFTAVVLYIDNSRMKRWISSICLLLIITRELSIGRYGRSAVLHKHNEGTWSEALRDGADLILDYCEITGIYVIVICILLLILINRGFWHTKPKE